MSWKFQVFYDSDEGFGWSEDYWYNGPTNTNALATNVDAFLTRRIAFMTGECNAVWVRVQRTLKRFPNIFNLRGANYHGDLPGVQNNVNNRVLVRMENDAVGFNEVYMAGIPDSMVAENEFRPTAAFLTPFNIWRNWLASSGLWNVVSNLGAPQPAKAAISMKPVNPRGIEVKMFEAAALGTAKKVRVTGVSKIGYNGVKNVIRGPFGVDNDTYILGGAAPQQDAPVGDAIFLRPLIPADQPITICFLDGFHERKAGRPFNLPVGRRPTLLPLRR